MVLLAVAAQLVGCSEPAAPSTPTEAIVVAADRLHDDLIAIRRDLHSHPELSGDESRTAGVVADRLRTLGLEVRTDVGGHGVVGVLRGAQPGPVVGYRADMDAVSGDEPPGRSYGSTVPGVFHICGHDMHTTIGLGIATVLASLRDRMRGTVVFYFQPAEETIAGARAMLDARVLDDPRPDVIYAVHSWAYPVGTIARGAALAGLDRFTVVLHGAAATPEMSATLVARLSSLSTVQRPRTPEAIAAALAALELADGPFARFVVMNVKPAMVDGELLIQTTYRAAPDARYPEVRSAVEAAISEVLAPELYTLTFADAVFPSMVSDVAVTEDATASLAAVVGADHILDLKAIWPFNGEDFALFLHEIPGAMFLLGVANAEAGISGAPHTPDFDADEGALGVGTKALSNVIWERLERPGA
jgi:amidohydrolase